MEEDWRLKFEKELEQRQIREAELKILRERQEQVRLSCYYY